MSKVFQLFSPPFVQKHFVHRHDVMCNIGMMSLAAIRLEWHTFGTLSFLADTFIFLYVGMDALDIDKWRIVRDSLGTSFAVSSILIALLMLGRAAFVFPLSFLPNLAKKNQSEKINFKMQLYSFMRPVFGGRGFGPFVSSSPTERDPPGLRGV
ncbi:hypothetical protein IGI04_024514 [Brassica rapa subsp. trilocularis]|uniref:Cation/H+ exchanger domain-containing protein n=2 Tax=Brassica TaxID=3705 RepID=A0ABQ8D4V0_BRANA|nr:hypothetical protein IGI04_024514 [Brassica rapa subsp. trilocularis]KAH0923545.1 hypothetical protein HID58_023563 [Brassica napus]